MDTEGPPPQLDGQPGNVEMERTAESSSAPADPSSQSLSSKLKAHYNKGMRKPKVKSNALGSVLTPEIINRVAVPIFLFTMFSSLKIGVVDVMPLMYAGNDGVILLQQVMVVVIFTQAMVNWLGIRYVDSTYGRYLRLRGQPVSSKGPQGNALTDQAAVDCRDSSTARLLPLVSEVSESTKPARRLQDNSPPHPEPTDGLARDLTSTLTLEAEKANFEMERKKNQLSSISDLIVDSDKKTNLLTSDKLNSSSTPSSSTLVETSGRANPPSVSDMPSRSSVDDVTSPTPSIVSNGGVVTKSYPYWSWIPCFECGWTRPPRCHHCPICKTCVLKRDHHCFFAGACVGYRNHRYFFVFLIWAIVGSAYATVHGFPYIGIFLWQDMAYLDVLFPVAIVRFLLGYAPFQVALSVTTLWLLVYFDSLLVTFIYVHTRLIAWGLTSFEKACIRSALEIKDTRPLQDKIRAVFGKRWLLSFFIPGYFLDEPVEDPIEWADIQVFKH